MQICVTLVGAVIALVALFGCLVRIPCKALCPQQVDCTTNAAQEQSATVTMLNKGEILTVATPLSTVLNHIGVTLREGDRIVPGLSTNPENIIPQTPSAPA